MPRPFARVAIASLLAFVAGCGLVSMNVDDLTSYPPNDADAGSRDASFPLDAPRDGADVVSVAIDSGAEDGFVVDAYVAQVEAGTVVGASASSYTVTSLQVPSQSAMGHCAFDVSGDTIYFTGAAPNEAAPVLRGDAGTHIVGLGSVGSFQITAQGNFVEPDSNLLIGGPLDGGAGYVAFLTFPYATMQGASGYDALFEAPLMDGGAFGTAQIIGLLPTVQQFTVSTLGAFASADDLRILDQNGHWNQPNLAFQLDPYAGIPITETVSDTDWTGPFVYVPVGSPGFNARSILVAEGGNGLIAVHVDSSVGNPMPGTGSKFVTGSFHGILCTDPVTGDVLASEDSQPNGNVLLISGFARP